MPKISKKGDTSAVSRDRVIISGWLPPAMLASETPPSSMRTGLPRCSFAEAIVSFRPIRSDR